MTAEKLQDAITLLPSDLIAATDRLRRAPRIRVIRWQHWTAMAACFVLLMGAGLVFQKKGSKTEAAPEAPMAMAPQITMESAVMEVPAEEAAPEAPAEAGSSTNSAAMGADEAPAEDGLSVDHSHRFAEAKKEAEEVPSGYCGNLVTRITLDGVQYDLHGADSDAVTNILRSLDYDPDAVCRCMAEFTVDIETMAGIEVNLTEAFARCELGQAALTEQQVVILRDIVDNLQ